MSFLERLALGEKMFFDGAMGTEMARRGLGTYGELSLTNPADVYNFHLDFARLGIDCHTSNTFTTNRIYLESHGLKTDLRQAVLAGVKLARQAAKKDQFVFGDLGPTGRLLKPYGEYSEEDFIKNYKEQATLLIKAGVDGLIIETMTDLREAVCALQGGRAVTDLPIIVTMSFTTLDKGGRTVMGNSVAQVARELEKHGADVIGSNCGDLAPLDMAALAKMFRAASDLPLLFQPNAGMPVLREGLTVYDMQPDEFAAGAAECFKSGASLVGGCCGTTLEHMRALLLLASDK